MGLAIDGERFSSVDYRRFEGRLEECLVALERPGSGEPVAGAVEVLDRATGWC